MEKVSANQIKVTVLTPARKVLEAVGHAVYFPTTQGTVGILPGHAPLMAQVGTGVLHYEHENMSSFLSISGGLAEVRDNNVTLIVDAAEEAATIDVNRAQKALERARKRLSTTSKEETLDVQRAIYAEHRAMARIEVVTRHTTLRK